MKRLVVSGMVALGLILSFNANAQTAQEEVDMIQAAYGMDKKEMIAEFLMLSPDNPFWVTYDSYETERKELGKQRIALISNYASNYANLSDEEVDTYMKDVMSLKKSTDKLIDTYYKKVKKESGSKTAAQFYEIEYYILNELRLTILDNIPFFGELDD
jgi:hypothetical protein